MLRCQECRRVSRGMAIDWRAYLVPEDDGTEWAAFYCPDCAKREFGPKHGHAPADIANPS